MILSGQERPQIMSCNYLTTDLADALFKGQEKSSKTGLQGCWEVKGTFLGHSAQFPTQASLAGTGCPGPYPVEF